jgi:hypothetical protein
LVALKAELEAAKATVRKQAIVQARKEFEARAEAGTAQGIGLAHEFVLVEKLRQQFGSTARVTGVGRRGDAHLVPVVGGKELEDSLLVFENKRSSAITAEHLRDAAKAKRKSGAAFVILVTTAATFQRRAFRGLCRDGEILIVAPEAVLPLAYLLHTFLVALSQASLNKKQRANDRISSSHTLSRFIFERLSKISYATLAMIEMSWQGKDLSIQRGGTGARPDYSAFSATYKLSRTMLHRSYKPSR